MTDLGGCSRRPPHLHLCLCPLHCTSQLRTALVRRCDRCLSELVVKTFAVLEKYGLHSAKHLVEEER
jgi:hypothetical protein